MHTLETTLNAMIENDPRPLSQRDRHQAFHGRKRTNIESVRVIRAPSGGAAPSTTAGTPAIQQILQTSIANAGTTILGTLPSGPIDPSAINQYRLSDCWLLAAILAILFRQPNFFDDIIVPIGDGKVVVQLYSNGLIVQITTSLVVSMDYDQPGNGDIRPELLEKAYSLFRAGVSDYLQLNIGNVASALTAFGLDTFSGSLSAYFISYSLAMLEVVCLLTSASAPQPWVQDHFYVVRACAAAGNVILRSPWAGAVDLPPTAPAIIADPAIFTGLQGGAFPVTKRLQAAYVQQAAPPVAITPTQEENMINVSSSVPTAIVVAAATLFHDKLETQAGRQDIGFLQPDGYLQENLNSATGGAFSLAVPIAAPRDGSFVVTLNGASVGTFYFSATGSWAVFVNVPVPVTLPAGPSTIRIAPTAGSQYNVADMSLTPAPAAPATIPAAPVVTPKLKSFTLNYDAAPSVTYNVA